MAEHTQISRTSTSRSPPGPGGQMKGPISGSESSSPAGDSSKGAKAAVLMTFIPNGLLDDAPKLVWSPEETVTEMFLEMTLDRDSPLRRQQTQDPNLGGLGIEEGTALLFCPPTDSENIMGDLQANCVKRLGE
uniref:Uncharacterized protein n=1 Tax=Chromera velia CCMP2878 TaxID=1169474 RepID=A0A0G4HYP9_9ALVE|eukprot:Cvel_9529.t1-p1 / transcript=Cvel_9529.t1 / gene=Cvel_9529 / organism=Chromera_velia_CCMP2878 / gene_product=hypothetical protein / transcript_product=hypothetical protein / location=Cvel_scaffold552:6173-8070(-) / protein_length=132 / sequence_SO=supercontig / SO=protein_coding / is_pseudo=false